MLGIFACAVSLQSMAPMNLDANYTRPVSFYVNRLLPPTLVAIAFAAAIVVLVWYIFSKADIKISARIFASLGVFVVAFLFAATVFGEPTLAATFADLFPRHAVLC